MNSNTRLKYSPKLDLDNFGFLDLKIVGNPGSMSKSHTTISMVNFKLHKRQSPCTSVVAISGDLSQIWLLLTALSYQNFSFRRLVLFG